MAAAVARPGIDTVFREGVQAAVLAMVTADIDLSDRYTVAIKRGFETACWVYQPPHRIYLGTRMLEKALPGLSKPDRARYAASYTKHEFCHMLFTARDGGPLRARLKEERIPFGLLNLFEDARIEQRYRTLTGDRFDWLNLEQHAVPDGPSGLLFAMIQAEAPLATPAGPVKTDETREPLLAVWDEVRGFYLRMIGCGATEELLPLLIEWRDRFPEDLGDGKPGEGGGARDGVTSVLSPEEVKQLLELLAEDSEEIGGPDRSQNPVEIEFEGNGKLLLDPPFSNEYESTARADRAANSLARLFIKPAGVVVHETPSRKVDIRSSVLPGHGWRFQHLEAPRPMNYKLGAIFDCSGSMDGKPLYEGLVLMEALSILARRRVVQGFVVLSAVWNRGATWQRLPLPIPVEALQRFHAPGSAEGLQSALLANAVELRQCDQVLVYTDGNICDLPIDRKRLAAQQIHPVGLYVGEPEDAPDMQKHFAEFLVRGSVECLIEAIVARFRIRRC